MNAAGAEQERVASRQSRRRVVAAAGAGSAAALLAACGAGGERSTPADSQFGLATGATAGLRVFYKNNAEGKANAETFEQLFRTRHPDVKLTVSNEQLTGQGRDNVERLLTHVAAGAGPDIVMMDIPPQPIALKGAALALDPYTRKDKDWSKLQWIAPERQLGDWTVDGKLYAFSDGLTPYYLVYNKTLLAKQGIAPLPKRMTDKSYEDWTWDRYTEVLKAVTKRGADGTIEQIGNFTINFGESTVSPWLGSNGTGWFEYDKGSRYATKSLANTAPCVDAIQYLTDLLLRYKVGFLPGENSDPFQFHLGKAGMQYAGSWLIPRLQAGAAVVKDFEWDIAPMPHAKGKKPVHYALLRPKGWILSTTKYPQLAYEYTKEAANKDTEKVLFEMKTLTALPAFKDSLIRDAWVNERPPDNKALSFDVLPGSMDNIDIHLPWAYSEWGALWDAATKDVLAGKTGVRAAMENVARDAQPLIQQNPLKGK